MMQETGREAARVEALADRLAQELQRWDDPSIERLKGYVRRCYLALVGPTADALTTRAGRRLLRHRVAALILKLAA
jgi:hypothetical protein